MQPSGGVINPAHQIHRIHAMHFISQDDIELDNRHIRKWQLLTLEDVETITEEAGYIHVITMTPQSYNDLILEGSI